MVELCQAAAANNVSAMRIIFANGFDINSTDYDDRTALHVAARRGAVGSIRFLIRQGAKVGRQARLD